MKKKRQLCRTLRTEGDRFQSTCKKKKKKETLMSNPGEKKGGKEIWHSSGEGRAQGGKGENGGLKRKSKKSSSEERGIVYLSEKKRGGEGEESLCPTNYRNSLQGGGRVQRTSIEPTHGPLRFSATLRGKRLKEIGGKKAKAFGYPQRRREVQ